MQTGPPNMNIGNLQAFAYVAEYRSFSEAAKALYASESAISRQVKALESELGIDLFIRSKKGIVLTTGGALLIDSAQDVITAYERFTALSKQMSKSRPTLSVQYSGTNFEAEIIVNAGELIRERRSSFVLQPNIDSTSRLFHKLMSREVDLIVASGNLTPSFPGFAAERLCVSRIVLVAPKDHPLARAMQVHLADLRGETLVLPNRTTIPIGYDWMIRFLNESGLTSYDIWPVDSEDYNAIFSAVASHRGLGFVASWYKNPLPKHIAYVNIADKGAIYEYSLIWLQDNKNPMIGEFVRAARGYVKETYPQWAG